MKPILPICLLLFSSPHARASDTRYIAPVAELLRECQIRLEPTLEFNPLIARMWIGASNTRNNIGTMSNDDVDKFGKRTWPVLQQIASESETTVTEMLEDYLALQDLIVQESGDHSAKETENLLRKHQSVRRSLRFVENLAPDTKWKRNHWEHIGEVYRGIAELGVLAFRIEADWREHPTFDPFKFLSGDQVLKILLSLEVSSLDNVTKFVERRREMKELKTRRDIKAVAPPPLPVIMVRPPSTDPLAQISAKWLTSRAVPAAPAIAEDFFQETVLTRVVLQNLEIKENLTYQARTVWGRDLEVSFAKSVVKDYHNGDRENIRTLLRALINGRGDRAGIKLLGDIGPKIVEVKGYLAGHQRLIGCLDGNRLHLKRFDAMPDTRAGYFRRIPANLCD